MSLKSSPGDLTAFAGLQNFLVHINIRLNELQSVEPSSLFGATDKSLLPTMTRVKLRCIELLNKAASGELSEQAQGKLQELLAASYPTKSDEWNKALESLYSLSSHSHGNVNPYSL